MGPLRQLFTANLTTKVMALLMALALWGYAYFFSLRREEVHDIPLVVQPPEGWSVIEQRPLALKTVVLTYPTHAADRVKAALAEGTLRAVYRMEAEPPAALTPFANVHIESELFQVPPASGVRVVKWEPESFSFTLAKLKRSALKVELNLPAKPPKGYRMVGQPWWSPRTVMVTGPADVLDRAPVIRTQPIVLVPPPRGASPQRLSVGLQPFVEMGGKRYQVSCKDRVEYIVYLEREHVEKRFKVRIKTMHLLPDNRSEVKQIRPREVGVRVRGPEEALADFSEKNVIVWVDVDGLEPRATPHVVKVHWTVEAPNPERFEVHLDETEVAVDIVAGPVP